MEQTASLWDCGEFIAGAYKLEVVHAPGAPLHALLGKIFSLLSFGDVTKVALWINFLSAASTAFAVLFCFWTTTFLLVNIWGLEGDDLSTSDKLKCLVQVVLLLHYLAHSSIHYGFQPLKVRYMPSRCSL